MTASNDEGVVNIDASRTDLRSVLFLLHGDWGTGKSWFSQTGPAPRLVLDAEGRADMTFGRKVYWTNVNDAPPVYDGTWDTCIVSVLDLKTLRGAVSWLVRGRHPFNTVVLDSLSEIQKRIIDEIVGSEKMEWDDFGVLFRKGEAVVRQIRDLKTNPVRRVPCVVVIAGTVERGEKEKKLLPYVQGQLSKTLGGFPDIEGMIRIERDAETGSEQHRLLVRNVDGIQAKDATHTFLDGWVDITYDEGVGWRNNLETMMVQITNTLAAREKEGAV